MQFLPLRIRARLGMHWPLVHTRPADMESAIAALMSVVDLCGTVAYWTRSPVQPRSVHVLNLQEAPSSIPDWITVDVADATDPALLSRAGAYDLVYSNSVIEHVGGHARRTAFAANVAALA